MASCADCPDPLPVAGSGDFDSVEAAIDFASQVLFGLSGRQFPGACPVVIRPCLGANCGCNSTRRFGGPYGSNYGWWYSYPSIPLRLDGRWVNVGLCCGECDLDCISLPGPIREIVSVRIDGVTLVEGTDYIVNGFRQLCRLGTETWPCTQDVGKPATEDNTFEITYTRGRPITPAMRGFARILACGYLQALCNDDSCLPENVERIARDGVTISFEDADAIFSGGLTGIPQIDLWLAVVNPGKAMRPASVMRADQPKLYRRT